jgi:hypothetical protein
MSVSLVNTVYSVVNTFKFTFYKTKWIRGLEPANSYILVSFLSVRHTCFLNKIIHVACLPAASRHVECRRLLFIFFIHIYYMCIFSTSIETRKRYTVYFFIHIEYKYINSMKYHQSIAVLCRYVLSSMKAHGPN